jgi:hypothetical protein
MVVFLQTRNQMATTNYPNFQTPGGHGQDAAKGGLQQACQAAQCKSTTLRLQALDDSPGEEQGTD